MALSLSITGCCKTKLRTVYSRMVFNVLSRNCDDHTKNFAFLMDKTGNWRLSPAFDVCHSFRPGSAWVSQQSLSVNGKRQNITRDDFLLVGRQMNIKKAPQIIVRVNESVKKWNQYAEEAGVDAKLRDGINSTLVYFGE